MEFGDAVSQLKDGNKVARKGWNGKNMYLFIVHGRSLRHKISDCYGSGGKNDPGLEVWDAIYMKTAQNTLVPWLASQSDVLADDWVALSE